MEPLAVVGQVDTATGAVALRVTLRGTVDEVWQALTSGQRLTTWLGRSDVGSITEGSEFSLRHDDDVRSRHAVLGWRPHHLLALTWDFPEEPPSRVTFELTATTASTTALTVHHEGLAAAVPYAAGWHRHLQYLDAHLRHRDLAGEDFWTGYEDLVAHYSVDRGDG